MYGFDQASMQGMTPEAMAAAQAAAASGNMLSDPFGPQGEAKLKANPKIAKYFLDP